MARNKPRLQVALYARPKHPGTYHYALFISPHDSKLQSKNQQTQLSSAIKYHVKNTLQNIDGEISQPWRFERISVPDVLLEQRLLVRLLVGKVVNADAVERVLENVPVYQASDADQVKAREFNCLTWIRAALEELRSHGIVSGLRDWEEVQKSALEYIERKTGEGRWTVGWTGEEGVPLFDLLQNREVVG